MISGIAGYLKSVQPQVQVVGCSPENSQVMIQSVKAGKILDIPSLPTLSDGTAGGVEEGAITFDLCRALVIAACLYAQQGGEDRPKAIARMRIILLAGHRLAAGHAAEDEDAGVRPADRWKPPDLPHVSVLSRE